ncbi:wings apart-like protein regulation of heterochromatin-domain-containing protein [Dichotomopilus funicola]|uniref:Wings apart-like protein regulation of heterochromatin-domain-containing protein n=1 Tax=Dichotomopilus funicola TaxID=1934379 RepID=A0AAN6V2Z2_9PEZI|nr:wings apart-like protein regulation of heterochromatin-domain-containing protein [Dichotomopilus funicola]
MAASNADSIYDFGYEPKKKVATYGRGGKRRTTETTRPATLRHAESAPVMPSSFDEPEPQLLAAPRLTTRTMPATKAKRPDVRKPSGGARQKLAAESYSQPLPDPYDIDLLADETTRTKKRRVAPESSDKGKFTGPYSTPDSSPPGARSPVLSSEDGRLRSAPDASISPVSRKTTPERKMDMDGDSRTQMPFSAKTSRRLKNLSVGSKITKTEKQQIPIRLGAPAAPSTPLAPKPTKPARKRRLIDALVAQEEDGTSSSDDDEAPFQGSKSQVAQSPLAEFQYSPPPATSQPKPIARPVLTAKKTGPKFTYSQQRSMLADDEPFLGGGRLGGFDDGPSGSALFNLGRLTKSATVNTVSYLDEDDETMNTGAVRSIHELRQAGANSRFADEMDDILDRVGLPSAKPNSLRRGALLELAQKMKDKEFRQQFRNHSDGGSLFRSLADETDLASGYAILAIITTLLAATTSAHLLQQLRSHGLGALISRLVTNSTDIGVLVKDRKQNLTKNGQTTVTSVKGSLLELPVWEPFAPTSLSPRTLALKCLDLLMRQPTHAAAEDEVLSQAVTDRLFSILSEGVSNEACWDLENQKESCDFYLALYVLEGHSISAMQSPLSPVWTKQYAPIVADILETALQRPADQLGDLGSLTLRISLNITNHNEEASRLFVEKGLLRRLADSTCGAFEMVLSSMKADSFMSKVLETLIMMLGAMINFCVYYPPGSRSLEERGDGAGSSLNRLIRVFADNHTKTADADSMEKTQLNVALGYLSVLLGYLCLTDSIRDRFILVHPKKNIQPLLDSLNEFITFHRKVAEAQGDEAGKHESGSLARLQNLADQLATLR